jgi:pseudouridine synthase
MAERVDLPLDDEGLIRLQKLLALAGVASRRRSEELMLDGEVEVNGEVVTRLGTKVNPATDVIRVSGRRLPPVSEKVYLALNKPRGVVSTMSDPEGRRTLQDLVDDRPERLFHVGRLDTDTSGLLILTNDGELAHVLAHPSFGVTKTYIARVRGVVTPQTISRLTKGVELEDGPIAADKAKLLQSNQREGESLVEITLHSGRNRIVRRMLAEVGHPVVELVRRQFGPLHLGTLKVGQLRDLTKAELGQLLTISRESR